MSIRIDEKDLPRILGQPDYGVLPYSVSDANVADTQPGEIARGHKYGAVATDLDGIRFDSKAESQEYARLKMLERCGDITDLELQPSFELQPAFECRGERIKAITYRADFAYTRAGVRYVIDVKGFKTPEYKLKRKLFLFTYPDLMFVER